MSIVLPFTAKIADADVPNKNGRIYTTETLQKAIDKLPNAQCIGKIDMPAEDTYVRVSEASHYVDNLQIVDGQLIGTIHVMPTEQGQKLAALLGAGLQFDYRTSGRGNVKDDGVITDFELYSINAVVDGA